MSVQYLGNATIPGNHPGMTETIKYRLLSLSLYNSVSFIPATNNGKKEYYVGCAKNFKNDTQNTRKSSMTKVRQARPL